MQELCGHWPLVEVRGRRSTGNQEAPQKRFVIALSRRFRFWQQRKEIAHLRSGPYYRFLHDSTGDTAYSAH